MFGFPRVRCLDAEYGIALDGRPITRCMVITELPSRRCYRLWLEGESRFPALPFRFDDPDCVWVAYNVPSELGVIWELGEPTPRHIIDLWPEFMALTNGRRGKGDRTRLIDALAYYGLHHIDADEKEEWQQLAIRGGPEMLAKKEGLLDYCQSDVEALVALLEAPQFQHDIAQSHPREMLFRGRFMVALARMHRVGYPVDAPGLHAIMEHRAELWVALARRYEEQHQGGIFDADGVFHMEYEIAGADGIRRKVGYEAFLDRIAARLPRTKKRGKPTTKGEILEKYEVKHPELTALRQCLHLQDVLSEFAVPVDADSRSRPFWGPFGSITGRNQPSTTKNLFSMHKLFRCFIQPPRDYGILYVDCSAQEVWAAFCLSDDNEMRDDYPKDIYTQSLIKVGKLSPGSTKDTDPGLRNRVGKPLVLAPMYGQTEHGLSLKLGITPRAAKQILMRQQRARSRLHRWQRSIINGARRRRTYYTPLGWPYWTGNMRSARSIRNFPMQSTGSDWMRAALIALTEAGFAVCAAAHDGFLLLARVEEIDEVERQVVRLLKATGEALLGVAPEVSCEQKVLWSDQFNRFDPGKEHRETWEFLQREIEKLQNNHREVA